MKTLIETTFPARLRAWRKSHRWTQAYAAAFLGRPVATYRHWEVGRHKPQRCDMVDVESKLERFGPVC